MRVQLFPELDKGAVNLAVGDSFTGEVESQAGFFLVTLASVAATRARDEITVKGSGFVVNTFSPTKFYVIDASQYAEYRAAKFFLSQRWWTRVLKLWSQLPQAIRLKFNPAQSPSVAKQYWDRVRQR